MSSTVIAIAPLQLALATIPVGLVLVVLYLWSVNLRYACYALLRMLVQLLIVGYLLSSIFAADHAGLVLLVLLVMVTASSWIALGTIQYYRSRLYRYAFVAILVGGGVTLLLISQLVLRLQPWYQPHYLIPLAGMIFANAMNSVSLAAERVVAELDRGLAFSQARHVAFNAALIPVMNSMLAVGLVSLPGMMTGQILSGVSPIVAAHYQIVVMCMIFGSAGMATALFLMLSASTLRSFVRIQASKT